MSKLKTELKFSISKSGNHFLEFASPIGISQGGQNNYQGIRKSTMELWVADGSDMKKGQGEIEWDVPSLQFTSNIGIYWENGTVRDYDGISDELPKEAKALIRKFGLKISRDL